MEKRTQLYKCEPVCEPNSFLLHVRQARAQGGAMTGITGPLRVRGGVGVTLGQVVRVGGGSEPALSKG